MKKSVRTNWLLTGSAAFFVACFLRHFWPIVGPDAWRPRLVCPEPMVDFGRRTLGETVPLSFTLQNTGFRDLRVERVTPSCGCVRLRGVDRPVIVSHGVGELKVQMDLEENVGETRVFLLIESNDPIRPRVIVGANGTVTSPALAASDMAAKKTEGGTIL